MLLPIILIAGLLILVGVYFLTTSMKKVKHNNVPQTKINVYLSLAKGEIPEGSESERFFLLAQKYLNAPVVNATVERICDRILSGYKEGAPFESQERATVFFDKISTSVIDYEGERDDRLFSIYGSEELEDLIDKFAIVRAISVLSNDYLKDKFNSLFGKDDVEIETIVSTCVVSRTKIKERVARVAVIVKA